MLPRSGLLPVVGFPWDVPQSLRCVLEPELDGIHVIPIALLLCATKITKLILLSNDPDDIFNYAIIGSWRPQKNAPYTSSFIEPAIDVTPELGPFVNHGHAYLKDLHLEIDREEWSLNHPVFTDIINKPGLSTLSMSGGFKALDFFRNKLPSDLLSEDWPSSLKVWKLRNCFVDARSFEYILRNCPKLIDLRIHLAKTTWTFQGSADPVSWALDLEHMGQVLRNYGSNLISLHLDFYQYKLTHTPTGRIGSLSGMTSLRHLQCYRNDFIITQGLSSDALIPDDPSELYILPIENVLPPSIVTLNILYEQYGMPPSTPLLSPPRDIISAEIESLLCNRRLQALQQIRVQIHNSDCSDWGAPDTAFSDPGSSDMESADSDVPDELILFQTKMPGWSFGKRTLRSVPTGSIEYVSIDRVGGVEVSDG
ncbi:unnamed protein product [Clonostachys rosea]|uniref:F-box domain-containing protein n=1 Tax=Bionectria ochroleuca TaxID=29856 RepID=A0ABY6UWH4_BIOOC|nr:unnamed protein product [Clonostachys rosea]